MKKIIKLTLLTLSIFYVLFTNAQAIQPEINGNLVSFKCGAPNATTTYWTFGNGSVSFQKNPFMIYSDTGTYQVRLVLSIGYDKVDTAYKTIQITEISNDVIDDIFVPYVDIEWFPDIDTSVFFDIKVYDRLNNLVFFSNNKNVKWDGKDVAAGRYIYLIQTKGVFKYGTITLVK